MCITLPPAVRGPCHSPTSAVRGGRLGRFSALHQAVSDTVPKRSAPTLTREPKSPRVTFTGSTSMSSVSGSDRLSQRTDSPIGRRFVPAPQFQGVEIDPIRPIAPCFDTPRVFGAPVGNELDTDHRESICATSSPPNDVSRKHVFDRGLKNSVCGHAVNFPETPPLLFRLRKSGVPKGRITALTTEVVTQQCESAASAKCTTDPVSGLVRYFVDFRSDEQVILTGDSSPVLIRDYLEQADAR